MQKPTKRQLALARAQMQAGLLVAADIQPGQMTPLQYLLKVINEPNDDSDRKDRLASAAAPYCHPKLMERHTVGKKDQQADAAEQAGMGTPWVDDIEPEIHPN